MALHWGPSSTKLGLGQAKRQDVISVKRRSAQADEDRAYFPITVNEGVNGK